MEPIIYEIDTTANYLFTATDGWFYKSSTCYYAIIPLEIGKFYKVVLQNFTDITTFYASQSDSDIIGSAELFNIISRNSPSDNEYVSFVAEKKYLICHTWTTSGGKLSVINYSMPISTLANTRWKINSTETKWITSINGSKFKINGSFYEGNELLLSLSSNINISINANSFECVDSNNSIIENSPCVDNFYAKNYWRVYVEYGGVGNGWVMRDLNDTLYLEIIDGVDVENITLISWLLGTAELQDITSSKTTITYNETTTTITEGQTATVKCANKVMKNDVVVIGKCKITYNGVETNVSDNQTATIKCKNKQMLSDVLVSSLKQIIAYKASIAGLGNESPTSQVYTKDEGFPTSFEEVTDKFGNIFIKIPTMYRKIDDVVDNQITAFTMSTVKVDDTYEPYSVFVKPDGSVMPYVLIGKYCYSSDTSANSTSSGDALLTIENARNYARVLGNGYQQYDWQFQKLFVDLALLISQTVNFNTGETISTFLGVYDLDKRSVWIDGVCRDLSIYRICYDPDKYINSPANNIDGYVDVDYSAPSDAGNIKSLGYSTSNPFFNYPKTISSYNNNSIYYCDTTNYNADIHPIASYIGFNRSGFGLWECDSIHTWDSVKGSRLCYRPLDESI
jgi:hypothetical protein